ncbi:hypothetical protein KKG63_02180, partial [Patescibacteria group bacterium]|nr:hypothetical protein [Patescibacteria group bacterium]
LVPVLVDVSAVIVACFVLTMNVEDYLWFLIHPYYGPDRYSAEYVPWIQHYVAGLQVSYLWSVGGVTILVALSAIATRMYLALLLWFCVLTVVILCTALIKRHQRKIPRKELQKYWWQSCRYVVIARCPFPIESRPPFLEPVAWVMDGSAFARALVEGGLTRI